MTVGGKYFMTIIMTSNRFMLLKDLSNRFYDETENIEKDTLNYYIHDFCSSYANPEYEGLDVDICDGCILNGNREYDRWCTCILLIYLNKALVGCWRDSDGKPL